MRDCRNRGMQITPEIKCDSICSWLWSACLLFLCIDCGQIDLAIKGRHEILSSRLAKESYASEISSPIFREKVWLKFMKGRGWDDKCIILPAIDYSFIRICIWVNDNQSEDFDLHVLALTWRLSRKVPRRVKYSQTTTYNQNEQEIESANCEDCASPGG